MIFKLAEEVARELPAEIKVRKMSATSEEAKKYGKVADAHVIAEIAKMTFDREKMRRLARVDLSEVNNDHMRELETEVTPYREKAEEMGYLMTPVLVVNQKVKSMGFIPDKEKIREWIENELRH
jgi:hypothetical protein